MAFKAPALPSLQCKCAAAALVSVVSWNWLYSSNDAMFAMLSISMLKFATEVLSIPIVSNERVSS